MNKTQLSLPKCFQINSALQSTKVMCEF